MLNNDDRNRPALEAQQQYLDTEVHDTASADWLAVVDYLWQEFARTTTPRPRHDDDLAGLAARENAGYREAIDWAAQAATLEGTVSGLRAELAATLRRLDDYRRQTETAEDRATAAEARNVAGERALEQVTTERDNLERTRDTLVTMVNSLREQIAGQERYLGNIAADLDREQEAHRRAMRDLETAREAAEQYRRDAVDAALRLGRIRKTLDD